MINLFAELERIEDEAKCLERNLHVETDSEEKGDLEQRLYELVNRTCQVRLLITQGRLSASEEEIQAAK